MNYCCTTPLPTGGVGNLVADPQLASATCLSANSPCRGAGSAAYASGTDIDGEAWLTPPSIGCDEYHLGAVTGPLSVSIAPAYTNVAAGFEVGLAALIEGRATASVWDFGDGTVVSNRPYATHAWAASGDYAVVLRAYNDSHPGGVSATVGVHVVEQPVHYVAADSVNPLPPYASWATAATNIQDAVDAAAPGALVLVSNGIYASGGRDGSRVVVEKPLTLRSVNGPEVTVIEGEGGGELWPTAATRCVFLVSRASLSGFTLTNGSAGGGSGGGVYGGTLVNCKLTKNAAWEGGGACASTLRNCILSSNHAEFYGGGAHECTLDNCSLVGNTLSSWAASDRIYGAGAAFSTLKNCTLTGNEAADRGGGAAWSVLNNCTLTGNSSYSDGGGAIGGTLNNCTLTGNVCGGAGGGAAWSALNNCTLSGNSSDGYGGGAYEGTLNNCIIHFNAARYDANCFSGTLNYCCTTPIPEGGVGNITADPQFVNTNNWSDLRLQPNSPCIDAGTNLTGLIATDLLGLPRPMDGDGDGLARFDIGAYEFNPYRFEPALHLTGDGFWFTVRGEPGRSVRIERSRDLVNWEYAGEVPIPACGQTLIDPAATTEPHLFYRAMRVP